MTETAPAQPLEQTAPPSPPVDSNGHEFDPARHRPEKDAAGRWKHINRGGRKPTRHGRTATRAARPTVTPPAAPAPEPPPAEFGDVERIAAGAPTSGPQPGAETPATPAGGPAPLNLADEYTQAAAGVVAGISTVAIMALGAHVAPTAEQTHAMVNAYAQSFRAYGYKPEVPPWLPPVIATAAWVGPHLADERSQKSLLGWRAKWAAFKSWLTNRGAVRAAAQSAADAHT